MLNKFIKQLFLVVGLIVGSMQFVHAAPECKYKPLTKSQVAKIAIIIGGAWFLNKQPDWVFPVFCIPIGSLAGWAYYKANLIDIKQISAKPTTNIISYKK